MVLRLFFKFFQRVFRDKCIECEFINASSVWNASMALRIHQCRLLTIRVAQRWLLLPNQPPELKSFSRHGHASVAFRSGGWWCTGCTATQFFRFPENKRARWDLPARRFCLSWYLSMRKIDVNDVAMSMSVYSDIAFADAHNEKQQRRHIIPRKIIATRSHRDAERIAAGYGLIDV